MNVTQEQYNTIVKIIRNGAPALADELLMALGTLINDYQELKNSKQEKEE